MPNLILIAGNGRNVGKTHLACQIINQLAKKHIVTGLKISPHFHEINEENILVKNEKFVIAEEKQFTSKDSSRMIHAGAEKVYFVMVKQENLSDAIDELIKILPQKCIVAESGGLHEFVTPGMFLFVKRTGDEIVKSHLLDYSPFIVNNDGNNFDFNIQRIGFEKNIFSIK